MNKCGLQRLCLLIRRAQFPAKTPERVAFLRKLVAMLAGARCAAMRSHALEPIYRLLSKRWPDGGRPQVNG